MLIKSINIFKDDNTLMFMLKLMFSLIYKKIVILW